MVLSVTHIFSHRKYHETWEQPALWKNFQTFQLSIIASPCAQGLRSWRDISLFVLKHFVQFVQFEHFYLLLNEYSDKTVPTKQNVANCWFYKWVIENSNYRIFLTGTWIQGTTASGSNSLENIAPLVENTMLLVCPFMPPPPQLPYLPEIRLHHARSHSF